jgi:Trk K+ transport system NAD-binding subunit
VEASSAWRDGGHVIVCGLKGLGVRTVEQLHLSGIPVVVVDDEPDMRLASLIEGWGIPHIRKSAQLGDGLLEAGIEHARAVICVENNEVLTLEIALRIHDIRPDVRVVVQMANPSVGRELERVTGAGSVLDTARLAAPSFVEACLGRPWREMNLGGVKFVVVETEIKASPGEHDTLRGHFGNLVPIAVSPADGGEMAICPGRDHPAGPGDRAAVLGTIDDLVKGGFDPDFERKSTQARLARLVRWRRRAQGIWENSSKPFLLVLATLFGLILTSTTVIHFSYHVSDRHPHLGWLTSLYFTVETVATVGFGDFSFGAQSVGLRVFGTVLIVTGVSLVSTTFALFTNILVSRRIEQSLGRGRVPGMSGHIVVVGLGAVGVSVVEELVELGQRVVVVERSDSNRYLARARALGVPVVIADSTQLQTHKMVNLADAAAVAVLTSSDFTNIETGLAVRESLGERWDDVPVVLRVFDRNLAQMMERSFGFRHVRSTSELAAPWFVGAALGLDVLNTFYVDHQPFLVGRATISPGGGLQGVTMLDLSARTRVVAIQRAGDQSPLEHPPRRGTRFAGGDQAYMLGPYDELIRVLRRDQAPPP